jgi:hypothetical protein
MLLVVAKTQTMDMKEVMTYELGPISWSLTSADESWLVKTTQFSLAAYLEKDTEEVGSIPEGSS